MPRNLIGLIVGVFLMILGMFTLITTKNTGGVIPLLIGESLCYLGWRGGRTALIIFGHTCIVVGCFLITWGIYLLPYSKPTLSHILTRPLFWGVLSVMGGICANYHGFCQCIRKEEIKRNREKTS